MARIPLRDLIRALSEHPDYNQRWRAGVPAEQALYITLGDGTEKPERPLDSEDFDAIDGSLVVLDRDSEGRVRGIEIT